MGWWCSTFPFVLNKCLSVTGNDHVLFWEALAYLFIAPYTDEFCRGLYIRSNIFRVCCWRPLAWLLHAIL